MRCNVYVERTLGLLNACRPQKLLSTKCKTGVSESVLVPVPQFQVSSSDNTYPILSSRAKPTRAFLLLYVFAPALAFIFPLDGSARAEDRLVDQQTHEREKRGWDSPRDREHSQNWTYTASNPTALMTAPRFASGNGHCGAAVT